MYCPNNSALGCATECERGNPHAPDCSDQPDKELCCKFDANNCYKCKCLGS